MTSTRTFEMDDLFEIDSYPWKRLLPKIERVSSEHPKIYIWDIPYAIPQLSYLTHGHFRYYGKFPSVVAGQILEKFPPPTPEACVLDNFCGSGTTLVEAKIRGIRSCGIDVNWMAALASNVKVKHVDLNLVRRMCRDVLVQATSTPPKHLPQDEYVTKWFTEEAINELAALKHSLLELPHSCEKDFLVVAYLAVIRRVSRAYDGEVRPHINKKKRNRSPISAFKKKISDMVDNQEKFQSVSSKNTDAKCFIGDNRCLTDVCDFGKEIYLVISHPAYLNSFDYAPVFKLERYWGHDFTPYDGDEAKAYFDGELRAYPANNDIRERYYEHLSAAYKETYKVQPIGGRLAIVIGDCTMKGHLEPVLEKTIELVTKIGYELEEINYRTTHYGLGKYAYDFRADYHGEKTDKKDGILIFIKS